MINKSWIRKSFSFNPILAECVPAAGEEVIRNCLEQDGIKIDEKCFQDSISEVVTKHTKTFIMYICDAMHCVTSGG